jgi:hypothetical protein
MATRQDLQMWVREALQKLGGRGRPADVARRIWDQHERDLRASGDLFYTWQYDMRWAALQLRKQGILHPAERSAGGVWELTSRGRRQSV